MAPQVKRIVHVDLTKATQAARNAGALAVAKAGASQAATLAPFDLGQLRGSIHAQAGSAGKAKYGTNVDHAAAQEFGATIKVTKKMRGYLAAVKGWHLKKSTTTITIPPTKYMRNSAVYLKRVGGKIYAKVLQRSLRNG